MTPEMNKVLGPLTEKTAKKIFEYAMKWGRDRVDMHLIGRKVEGGVKFIVHRDISLWSYAYVFVPYGSMVDCDSDGDLHIKLGENGEGGEIELSCDRGLCYYNRFFDIKLEAENGEVRNGIY